MAVQLTNALFIDGANLYATAKTLGFDIDYKRLLREFQSRGYLLRAFYYTAVIEDQEYSSIRPLIDWLDYNGYTVVTKATKEFVDQTGRRKVKGNMDIELAVDAMEIAEHVDQMVLFSAMGIFLARRSCPSSRLACTVVSTISPSRHGADELRRQADVVLTSSSCSEDRRTRRSGAPRAEGRPRYATGSAPHAAVSAADAHPSGMASEDDEFARLSMPRAALRAALTARASPRLPLCPRLSNSGTRRAREPNGSMPGASFGSATPGSRSSLAPGCAGPPAQSALSGDYAGELLTRTWHVRLAQGQFKAGSRGWFYRLPDRHAVRCVPPRTQRPPRSRRVGRSSRRLSEMTSYARSLRLDYRHDSGWRRPAPIGDGALGNAAAHQICGLTSDSIMLAAEHEHRLLTAFLSMFQRVRRVRTHLDCRA